MPSFVVRPYEDRDRESFGHVRSRVYRGGEPIRPDEDLLNADATGFVVEAGGVIVGTATALDMTCSQAGELHRCAGIAAVAVLPEWRGSGAGSALMRGLHPLLADMGYVVASLHPFRDPWYARFGYVRAGMRLQIKCPADRLPRTSPEVPVREIRADEWPLLERVRQRYVRDYSGFNLRSAEHWERMLGGNTPLTLYVCGDPIEAYAGVRLKGDFWVEQDVREFLWTTDRAYRSMLAFFRSLAINKGSVSWIEPGDGRFWHDHYDRVCSVEVMGPLMYRLLDSDEDVAERTRAWLGDPQKVYCTELF